MKKIFILLLTMICIIVSSVSVFAATAVNITDATYDKVKKIATVKGTVSGASPNQEITIIAYKTGTTIDSTTIAYIDQVSNKVIDGKFVIEFKMAATAVAGNYTIRVGGDGIATPAERSLTYDGNNIIFGDVTGDAQVDIFDVLKILAYANSTLQEPFTAEQLIAADVDGNPGIDIFDVLNVLQKANDSSIVFPVEKK